jgi:shikimate dehydrogenase
MNEAPPPDGPLAPSGGDRRLRAAVLGSPIAHSKSPALHRAAYAGLGVDWAYDAIEVDEAALAAFMGGLGPEWAGLSLTMPLKQAVIPLVDWLDPRAAATAAVNTVVLPGAPTFDGTVRGYNTDVAGIVAAVQPLLAGRPDSVVILGSGATARSAAAAAVDLGATHVDVVARRRVAAEDVARIATDLGSPATSTLALSDRSAVQSCVAAADLVISTLPAGAGELVADVELAGDGVLLDVVYAPWPTALARSWDGPVAPGSEMLLLQAVAQVRLMTGLDPDVDLMRQALSG